MSAGDSLVFNGAAAYASLVFTGPARVYAVEFTPTVGGWVGLFDALNAGGVNAQSQVAIVFTVAGSPIGVDYTSDIIAGRQVKTGIFIAAITAPGNFAVGPATGVPQVAYIPGANVVP
jgi:hypothetical protein